MANRLVTVLAATIEHHGGLPCGGCGGRHVATVQEPDAAESACTCPCCHGPWAESFEAEFPHLVITRGGVRVITQAAMDEGNRRLEAELASLEEA